MKHLRKGVSEHGWNFFWNNKIMTVDIRVYHESKICDEKVSFE